MVAVKAFDWLLKYARHALKNIATLEDGWLAPQLWFLLQTCNVIEGKKDQIHRAVLLLHALSPVHSLNGSR